MYLKRGGRNESHKRIAFPNRQQEKALRLGKKCKADKNAGGIVPGRPPDATQKRNQEEKKKLGKKQIRHGSIGLLR
jgi:hypothetical protein